MIQAIKTLEKKIELLNQEIPKIQKRIDEPEMVCDYEFAINEMGNIESQIIECQKAIEILSKQL